MGLATPSWSTGMRSAVLAGPASRLRSSPSSPREIEMAAWRTQVLGQYMHFDALEFFSRGDVAACCGTRERDLYACLRHHQALLLVRACPDLVCDRPKKKEK